MKAEPFYYVGPITGLLADIKRRAEAGETALLAALFSVLLTAALLGYLTPPAATAGATTNAVAAK